MLSSPTPNKILLYNAILGELRKRHTDGSIRKEMVKVLLSIMRSPGLVTCVPSYHAVLDEEEYYAFTTVDDFPFLVAERGYSAELTGTTSLADAIRRAISYNRHRAYSHGGELFVTNALSVIKTFNGRDGIVVWDAALFMPQFIDEASPGEILRESLKFINSPREKRRAIALSFGAFTPKAQEGDA